MARRSDMWGQNIIGSLANSRAIEEQKKAIEEAREKAKEDEEYRKSKAEQGGGLGGVLGLVSGLLTGGGSWLPALIGGASGYSSGSQVGEANLGSALAGVGAGASAGMNYDTTQKALKIGNIKAGFDVMENFAPMTEEQLGLLDPKEMANVVDLLEGYDIPALAKENNMTDKEVESALLSKMGYESYAPQLKGVRYIYRRPARPTFDIANFNPNK